LLENIWLRISYQLWIVPNDILYENFKRETLIAIHWLLTKTNNTNNTKEEVNPEIPEEIKEALKITEKAQNIQLYIIEKQKEIQEDKRNYYKKYW